MLRRECDAVTTNGVRTLQDCRLALVSHHLPLAAIEITEDWFHAERGVIPDPQPDDEIIGCHAVTLRGLR